MSGLYLPTVDDWLAGAGPDLTSETDIKLLLIDAADYTVDLAVHDFLDDVAAGAREEGPVTLTSTTVVGGVFDAANATFVAADGDPCEALIIYDEGGGADATRPLISYIDGISVDPNGGDINVNWDGGANKIFALLNP